MTLLGIPIFPALWILIYDALVIVTILVLVLRKRDTATIYGWALAIIFVPVVGMVLYFLFGFTALPNRLRRRMRHVERFRATFSRPHRDEQTQEDEDPGHWDQVTKLVRKLGCSDMVPGNQVDCLYQGKLVFDRMFETIERAEHHIHLAKFIFRDDHLGRELTDRLIEKARSGVEVRVLLDALGTFGGRRLLRKLQREGGRGAVFLPFFAGPKRFTLNLRNHRKILVVDGKEAFIGGLNVGDEYVGGLHSPGDWFDAHMQIKGPAVLEIQQVFAEDWDFAASERLDRRDYFPKTKACGSDALQVAASGPDQKINAFLNAVLAVTSLCHDRLFIASPYIVPDRSVRMALMNTAMRGVKVTLLTQNYPPDHKLPYWCARYYYEELFQSGVEIYEYEHGMMHAKVIAADDRWASIGSANLDARSMGLNFEICGFTNSKDLVRCISSGIEDAMERSSRVLPVAFRGRPRRERAYEAAAHLFAPLM